MKPLGVKDETAGSMSMVLPMVPEPVSPVVSDEAGQFPGQRGGEDAGQAEGVQSAFFPRLFSRIWRVSRLIIASFFCLSGH